MLTIKTLRTAALLVAFIPTISSATTIGKIDFKDYSNKVSELNAACKEKSLPSFTGFCLTREYGAVAYNDPTQTSITLGLEIASLERFYRNCEHTDFSSLSGVITKAKSVLEAQKFFDEIKSQEDALNNYLGRFYSCESKSENDATVARRLKWFEYMIQKFSADGKNIAYGQEPAPNNTPNSVLSERLRNAQITEKKLSNGAVFTEVKFAGSLQPNFDLSCISISDVTSKLNPPALIYAAKKCIQQNDYARAWALINTSNGFAYYDMKRLADRSTQGARTVLTMNAFADLTNEQRDNTQQIFKKIQTDPEQVKAYCTELTRIGPPTYNPQWAILHGIGAYQEPRNGDYLTNVDTKALWDEVLKNRCTPLTQ